MKNKKNNIVKTNNLNDLMFDVTEHDTKKLLGMDTNSEYSKMIIAHTNEGKKLINSCSEHRYKLVKVSDFAPELIDIVESLGLNYEANYKMINHAVFYGEIIIKDKGYFIGDNPNDVLNMRLKWFHSYNGIEKYNLSMGTFYRYLCANGLWMTGYDTQKYGLNISGKHTEKIYKSLGMLKDKLYHVLENNVMRKAVKVYEPLYDNWVSDWRERTEEVMNVAKIGVKTSNITHVNNVIQKEAKELYSSEDTVNDWLIYNGINNLIFSDKFIDLESAKVQKDRRVFEALIAS